MLINIIFTFLIAFILIHISIEDIKTMSINEVKLIILTLLGFAYLACRSFINKDIDFIIILINNFYGMIILFLIMYLLKVTSFKILKINSLGLGDIKIIGISSIWLGFDLAFTALCISFSISGIYSLYGKFSGRMKRLQQYPFAPFLSFGIFCAWTLDKF